jgi:hypothetical protein
VHNANSRGKNRNTSSIGVSLRKAKANTNTSPIACNQLSLSLRTMLLHISHVMVMRSYRIQPNRLCLKQIKILNTSNSSIDEWRIRIVPILAYLPYTNVAFGEAYAPLSLPRSTTITTEISILNYITSPETMTCDSICHADDQIDSI